MSWRPHATPKVAQTRATMLRQARAFFAAHDVLEVETPALSRYATMDPNIASMRVSLAERAAFLSTSPEYYMKRLLAADYRDIYQICRVFRDGESGRHHLPEFTMAEWYRLDFGLSEIIKESTDFISLLLDDSRHEPISINYRESFEQTLGFDPHRASLETIIAATIADKEANADLIQSLGGEREAWLDLAMAERVCKTFHEDRLTVIYHYPISQASLARQCPDNHELSDRFEIYFGTLELANGFVELTDANVQKERFAADRHTRRAKDLPAHEPDDNLIGALASGLPQCAGVAIGLDRLLMIRENVDHIRDVATFSPGQ